VRPQELRAARVAGGLDDGDRRLEQLPVDLGQDHVGDLLVDRLALPVALLEGRAVLRQRPAGALRPPPRRRQADVQQHDGVLAQRLADLRRAERPTAERDDRAVRVVQDLERHALLDLAERRLAVAAEVLRDGHPDVLLDPLVGVDRPGAQGAGDHAGAGRLAGPHESDEDDGGGALHESVRGGRRATGSSRCAARRRRRRP
jgi:hypothetical protein